jgi:hypothetical protein
VSAAARALKKVLEEDDDPTINTSGTNQHLNDDVDSIASATAVPPPPSTSNSSSGVLSLASLTANGGACMGGYISTLDLYLDCTSIIGFLSLVGSMAKSLEALAQLTHVLGSDDMKGVVV